MSAPERCRRRTAAPPRPLNSPSLATVPVVFAGLRYVVPVHERKSGSPNARIHAAFFLLGSLAFVVDSGRRTALLSFQRPPCASR